MFSRAAARTALRASMPSQRRMLQTTPIRATAAVTTPTSTEEEGIISKFGLYPFVGLAATAMVSKEVIILSEEALIAVNFSTFCLAAYIAAGNSVHQSFESERQANVKSMTNATNFRVKLIEAEIEQWTASKNQASAVKTIIDETALANKDYVAALALQKKHNAVQLAQSALDQIVQKEGYERSQVQGEIVAEAGQYVREAFARASFASKEAALNDAIANIGDGHIMAPFEQDPVKMLFIEYIQKGLNVEGRENVEGEEVVEEPVVGGQ